MQTITNEQIYDRWEQVPGPLREAFFSTDNGEIIWKICEDAGLSEDVIGAVLVVVGNVLLGFTHLNDFIVELKSIPNMNQTIVDTIIFQIDKRIFEPVKGDIFKLYRAMSGEGPKIVAEGSRPELAEGKGELMELKDQANGIEGKISSVNLRAMESSNEAVQHIQTGIRKIKIEGEGESVVNIQEQSMEEPAIIHEETVLKPIAQKKRVLSAFGGLFGFKRESSEKKEGPAVEAQVSMIEGVAKKPFGGLRTGPEEMARTEQQQVKVVHYTSAEAPQDMFGQAYQNEPASSVAKQEHEFEPTIVNLMAPPVAKESSAAARVIDGVTADNTKPLIEEKEKLPQINILSSMPIGKEAAQPVQLEKELHGSESARIGNLEAVIMPRAEFVHGESAEAARPELVEGIKEIPVATLMKTPQRPETIDGQKLQVLEPRLTEIPVADDAVDLRTLEKLNNNPQPTTDNR